MSKATTEESLTHESINRTQNNPLAAHYPQHTNHGIYLWTRCRKTRSCFRSAVGNIPHRDLVRSMDVERICGEEVVSGLALIHFNAKAQ